MKALLILLAVAAHGVGFAATLTGTVVDSSATVNLAQVGTLDWARWPGYTHKTNLISDVTTTGSIATYNGDPRIIGNRLGIKATSYKGSFQFTVQAATTERTLIYYAGGYQSTGRITVSLPGAPDYVTTFTGGVNYSKVVTIKFKADAAGTLRVKFEKVSGSAIRMQAAALQGAATGPSPTNRPPVISGTPLPTVLAGQSYVFTPSSSDPDGNTLTFTAVNLPGWASFNSATGRVAGTPTSANVGTYGNIRISVSDGIVTANLSAFSIQVVGTATGSVRLSWTPPTTNTNGTALTNLAGF